ncbi:MAG: hypothetical protein QW543_05480 [Sulfolobales archaeon]
MPRQKRRALPGALLLLALVGSAVAFGIYGNKILATGTGITRTETPIETLTYTETTEIPSERVNINATLTTPQPET